jgi:hypothetical protein
MVAALRHARVYVLRSCVALNRESRPENVSSGSLPRPCSIQRASLHSPGNSHGWNIPDECVCYQRSVRVVPLHSASLFLKLQVNVDVVSRVFGTTSSIGKSSRFPWSRSLSTMDHRCEESHFPMSASLLVTLNHNSFSSNQTGVNARVQH